MEGAEPWLSSFLASFRGKGRKDQATKRAAVWESDRIDLNAAPESTFTSGMSETEGITE